jgi:signal transduction histidine kinase
LRFDDRLQTMLDAPVADNRDRAIRWRQRVDMVSRIDHGTPSEAARNALEVIRRDAFEVDEAIRAATLRAIAGRKLPADLLRVLAAQPVRISAPVFAGLTLTASEAADLLADADDEVSALVTVTGGAAAETPVAVEPELPSTAPPEAPSISDMVERIERLQQTRKVEAAPPPRPRAATRPATAEGRLFEWESDASGHIAWVEGAPRGALVGRPLGGDGVGLLERQAASRLGQRHPFVDVPLAVGEPLAGSWTATGVPAFDPATGRFLGYRGLARRTDGAAPATPLSRETDTDALRELVHEIKTPLNAIIGFAEIIDGQYLGPAHRNYRERAAVIVGQARQLLEAVEDPDFAAKLRAARATTVRDGSRFSDLFPAVAVELEQCLALHGGDLEVDIDDDRHRCALPPELAGRLLRRLLLSLCRVVSAGETFRLAVSRRGAMCLLTVGRPRRLDGIGESQLLDPAFDPEAGDQQKVGLGFALRLVRGLARVAGGNLVIDEQRITLELPAAEF